MYIATKIIDGFSTCFRQYKAESHCRFLHGYALKFEIVFEALTLDQKNWVQDFGFLKQSSFKMDGKPIKEWFNYMFDHTTIVSRYDPEYEHFKELNKMGIIQMRELDNVGCEAFAEFVYVILDLCLSHDAAKENKIPVKIRSVKCIENEKNSASYEK